MASEPFEWRLENTKGSSNKYYIIGVEQTGSTWRVTAHWGRIGNPGRKITKTANRDYKIVEAEAAKLRKEKEEKGYHLVSKAIASTVAPGTPVYEQAKQQKINRFLNLE